MKFDLYDEIVMEMLFKNHFMKKGVLAALLFIQKTQLIFAGYSDHGRIYSVDDDGHHSGGAWGYFLVFLGILYAVWYENGKKEGKDRTISGCLIVIVIFIVVCLLIRACR